MASLNALPVEVTQQIIRYSTRHDLLEICLVHSSLYNVTVPEIYHGIHFLDPGLEVPDEHKWLFDNNTSSAIKSLKILIRSLQNSSKLRTLISVVALQWGHDLDGIVKSDILSLLRLIGRGLTRFHYAPPEWDLIIHRLYPVTSVYMPCPSGTLATKPVINSMFTVPTITYIALYQCDNLWLSSLLTQSVEKKLLSQQDNDQNLASSPIRTSAVEHLSILHTKVHVGKELALLMLLPKSLKVFHCALGVPSEDLSKFPLDPSVFIDVLAPQQTTLEEVSLDFINYTETYGTLGTSLRLFPRLRRLSMPHQFLVALPILMAQGGLLGESYDHLNRDMQHLYLALPPVLEDLVMNIDHHTSWISGLQDLPSEGMIHCMRDLAANKQELYPKLKRVVLWSKWGFYEPMLSERVLKQKPLEQRSAWEEKFMDSLDLKSAFDQAGIKLVYRVTDTAPAFF